MLILLLFSVDWKADLRNHINILFVKDHSENIGLFWYLFVELFKQHVPFYQHLYLMFAAILALQIALLLRHYIIVS